MSGQNVSDEDLQLKVQEARKRDIGKSIIRLDTESMNKMDVNTGDLIKIEGKDSITGAIAWPAYPQDQDLGIARIDGRIRENANVSLNDYIKISKVNEQEARNVVLAPISLKIKPNIRFESFVKRKIDNCPITKGDLVYIAIGMTKEIVFKVVSAKPAGISVIKNSTSLKIEESTVDERPDGVDYITYEDIGGLDREIQLVREMVELPLKFPELFSRLGIEPPKGLLLRGPPGCGKTLLAKAVSNESKAHFISINGPEIMSKFYGESEKKLRGKFKEAEENAPSIIFIDEIDAIAPKREKVSGEVERRVVAQMLALMDGLESRGRVIIIGATNRPNALDPALRRPGRFDRELEMKVPNEEGRMEILQIHTRRMPLDDDIILQKIANITHGYVGADIASLVREAGMSALRRYLPEIDLNLDEVDPEILERMFVVNDDFTNAFKEVVPSGIREVFVEVPKVHWSEVGGLQEIKQKLIEAVEWPIKNIEAYKRMGVEPPTGVLLYGPPGCGKTLLARAIATESEANFISIKGPELLSKWVGESEKAVREVFRKAKLASPCIIFFDELDSIAHTRGGSQDSNVTERVISQLLTELDGLSEAREIILIAATNRPDIIDPALIRPGRIDRLCYVQPPLEEDRKAIFKIFIDGMPLAEDVDIDYLAKRTEFFSGADIESLCREAAILALREDIHADTIYNMHFKRAFDEIRASIGDEMLKFYENFETNLKQKRIGKSKGRRSDLYA